MKHGTWIPAIAIAAAAAGPLSCSTHSAHLTDAQLVTAPCWELESSFKDACGYYGLPAADSYAARVRDRAMDECHIDWPDDVKLRIRRGEVEQGMTEPQVWWSWGPPSRSARETSPFGQVDRWEWGTPESQHYAQCTFRNAAVMWWSRDSH